MRKCATKFNWLRRQKQVLSGAKGELTVIPDGRTRSVNPYKVLNTWPRNHDGSATGLRGPRREPMSEDVGAGVREEVDYKILRNLKWK